MLKYQICDKNLMRRRLSYKELELKNKLLQDTLASTKKELAHYKAGAMGRLVLRLAATDKDLAHYTLCA